MKQGIYGGGTFGGGWPLGFGGGLYADNYGNLYPQLYFGSPKASISGGYTSDLEGLLTGPSISTTLGGVGAGPNFGTSGGANGFGFGTPGFGGTYGFGPYHIRDIGESFRPTTDEFGQPFPGDDTTTVSPPSAGSNSQNVTPGQRNPVLEWLDSFRPRTDEFGNPFPEQQGLGGVLKYGPGNAPLTAQQLSALFPDLPVDAGSEPETDAESDFPRLARRVVRYG